MVNQEHDRHTPRRLSRHRKAANQSTPRVRAPGQPQRIWSVLNTPLAVLLISGVAIGGGAKLYSDHQAAAAELSIRRVQYVEILAELQHRVALLQRADALLDPFIGVGETFRTMKPVPRSWTRRAAFDRACLQAGSMEADVLAGRGSYLPTSPGFAGVDMLTLAARLENLGGIPDLQIGSMRLIGLLNAPPDVLWLFVRAFMPTFTRFVVSRHLMNVDGQLPLPSGAVLTASQEAMLDLPQVHLGDLERIQRENDRRSLAVDRMLRDAAAE